MGLAPTNPPESEYPQEPSPRRLMHRRGIASLAPLDDADGGNRMIVGHVEPTNHRIGESR